MIEVNPRSSRTVPYISKVTGIPIVPLATKVIIGHKIRELGYEPGLQPEADYFAVKMPVFSFEKIRGADISLGPEMKSTGECLGIARTFDEALYKAFLGAGIKLPKYKNMILTVRDEDVYKRQMQAHKNIENPTLQQILDTEAATYERINSRR